MRLYDKRIKKFLDEINANPELKRRFMSKFYPSSSTTDLSEVHGTRGDVKWEKVDDYRIIFNCSGSKQMNVVVLGKISREEAYKKYLEWVLLNPHGSNQGMIGYSEVVRTVVF
ncbi:MAG: hypothetical protein HZB99_00435 [Candidatus Harrisonbacteria bacterium]|nr:hypothetical protein [Candidatus Harrisonbacteria bacterium]